MEYQLFIMTAQPIIVDGKIVAPLKKRFSRRKHDPRYPFNAVKYVLEESKISLNKIDHIVFFENLFSNSRDC